MNITSRKKTADLHRPVQFKPKSSPKQLSSNTTIDTNPARNRRRVSARGGRLRKLCVLMRPGFDSARLHSVGLRNPSRFKHGPSVKAGGPCLFRTCIAGFPSFRVIRDDRNRGTRSHSLRPEKSRNRVTHTKLVPRCKSGENGRMRKATFLQFGVSCQ